MDDFISRKAAIQSTSVWNGDVGTEAWIRDALEKLPAADVRPVVICSDCKWWTKQEASLQGRCELLQMYPTGTWFCANGKREESG